MNTITKTEEIDSKTCVRCENCGSYKPGRRAFQGRCLDLKQATTAVDYCELKEIPKKYGGTKEV